MPKLPSIDIPKGYCSQSEDTSLEIDYIQFQRWREMPLIKKANLTIGVTQGCRQLSLQGIKNQYPSITKHQLRYLYAVRILGNQGANIVKTWNIEKKVMIGNPVELALLIAEIFDILEIPYFVGGSLASSLWGESRATLDVDIVADLQIKDVNNFIEKVGSSFYVSENAIREAIVNQSSFNLINFETNEKIDIFILKNRPLSQREMGRRTLQQIEEGGRSLYLATPEDIILEKLAWYEQGSRISDRQWRDILGVLKAQGERLDCEYLNYWAEIENLSDLLSLALRQSGLVMDN